MHATFKIEFGAVVPMPTPAATIRPIVLAYMFKLPVPVVVPPWEIIRVE